MKLGTINELGKSHVIVKVDDEFACKLNDLEKAIGHKLSNNLIEFISGIRSSKSELKITPKLYCDIHFLEKSSKLNKIIQNNLILAKHVGRIGNILKTKKIDTNTIEILSQNEKISLFTKLEFFNRDIT